MNKDERIVKRIVEEAVETILMAEFDMGESADEFLSELIGEHETVQEAVLKTLWAEMGDKDVGDYLTAISVQEDNKAWVSLLEQIANEAALRLTGERVVNPNLAKIMKEKETKVVIDEETRERILADEHHRERFLDTWSELGNVLLDYPELKESRERLADRQELICAPDMHIPAMALLVLVGDWFTEVLGVPVNYEVDKNAIALRNIKSIEQIRGADEKERK